MKRFKNLLLLTLLVLFAVAISACSGMEIISSSPVLPSSSIELSSKESSSEVASTNTSTSSQQVSSSSSSKEVISSSSNKPSSTASSSSSSSSKIVEYNITLSQVTGGTISANKTKAQSGEEVTLSYSLAEGYNFGSYTVKQGSTNVTVTNNKFTMPSGNVTITATFVKQSFAITINQTTGGNIVVKNGSTTLSSGSKVEYGTTLTLSASASTGYSFKNYTVNGTSQTTTTIVVKKATTITASFAIQTFTVTLTQPTGGSIKINNSTTATRTVEYGTTLTLSNVASNGYIFSSYKVNGTSQTSTTVKVTANTTITGTFTRGIDGLSSFTYSGMYNYSADKTGTITKNGNAVSSSQTHYPSAISWVKGNFYYETEVALNSGKIYNGELYCKLGIVVVSGQDVFYGYIDALSNGYNNEGFGNNTWLGYAPGRGSLSTGINWSFFGSADHCGNFNKNYSSSTTYIKLGLMRVDGVYKFFANDKFMFSVWHPEATSSIQLGLLAFNIGFEAKNSKIGYGEAVINNANAYYGLSSNLHPTTRTIDGKVDGRAIDDAGSAIDISWKENLVNAYGVGDYTRYTYSVAFKGSDGIYVANKSRTKNYITDATNLWENTNLEIRATGGNNASKRIFFAANGQKGIANESGVITDSTGFKQTWTKYQETDGYYIITLEAFIPYSALGISNSSSTVKMNFAFRSEEVGLNMQDGSDGVWWCGFGYLTLNVKTSGLDLTKETTPTDKNIKPGVGGADPFVMPYNGKYYLYSTGNVFLGYKVYVSDDLNTWRAPTDKDFTDVGVTSPNTEMQAGWAFHRSWSKPVYNTKTDTSITCSNLWAPEVAYNSTTKKFVMTYSGYDVNNLAVVSVATSDSPLGPFVDVYNGEKGFLAPTGNSEKASIDASIFVDTDGQAYLYYCNDCTRNGIDNFKNTGDYWKISEIWVVKLDSTWTKTTGEHTKCITPYQDWETQNDPNPDAKNTAWNEGPYVYKHNGTYYMTYSANPFWNPLYGVGLAFATSPTGPWTKYHANPIVVKQDGRTAGTGHNMFFKDFNGKLWCAYHTYSDPSTSGNVPRELLLSRAWFDNGILRVEYQNW